MKHVWVAIPAYTGQIHLCSQRSLMTDLLALQARGDSFEVIDECGSADIRDVRALLVAKFLASEATHLVMMDSDVAWEAGALLRIVDAPVDFVAGMYPQRKDPPQFAIQWLPKDELHADPKTGLLEVAGVPAGFMRMSRAMLERMTERYAESLTFHCEPAPNKTAVALFESYWEGRLKFGEDYSFCRRWRDIGGQVWIDPEILMGHVGFKTFQGHIGNWLKGPR